MADFLKANPYMTQEEYLWKYSFPYIKILAHDATKTLYLSQKQYDQYKNSRKAEVYDDPSKFMNDLGIPIF